MQRIVLFNTAAEKILGGAAKDAVGQSLERFIPPRFHATHRKQIRKFAEAGVSYRALGPMEVLWAVRSNGEEFQIEASISQAETGGKELFTIILRDVTERKRAEEARERLAAVVESSDDAIIGKTLDGTITSWNPGAEKVFGYSASEAVGKPMGMLVPPERIREESDILARIGRGECVDHFETVRVRRDGKTIDVSATVSPIKDRSGAIVGASKIARDISERKRAEEVSREQSKILDLAQVSVCDMENRIVLWNGGVEKLYGFTREEALGHIAHELLHTEFPEPLEQIEQRLQRTGAWEGELMHRKRDGERIVVSRLWVLHRDAKGEPDRILKASADITARRQAEEQLARQAKALARQTDELARSNADLEQFAYVASHDLQEPLRMVAAYTQLLGERYRGRLDDNADKFIGYICEGALRMQTLIRDLLAFSRVGRSCGACAPVDCEAAMDEVLLSLGPAIKESGAVVTHTALSVVWADPSQLAPVFQNLIGNAIKFRGNEAPVISLQAEKTGEQWLFSVSDNGIGIPPEYAEHIFVVFHRLHTRTEYAGNGIGLAICKKIIEHCGGKIWVEAQAGHGSIFKFPLPYAGPAAEKEWGGEEMSMPSPRRGV
jgi:PAS domain S-box-containing protein